MGYLLLLKNNAPFTVVSAQEVTENVRTHDSSHTKNLVSNLIQLKTIKYQYAVLRRNILLISRRLTEGQRMWESVTKMKTFFACALI